MQPDLFIHGATFDSGIPLTREDHVALGEQLLLVLGVLLDGKVHTVADIAAQIDAPENSVAAQCRNLRKPKHGGYDVRRVHLGGRKYAYQLKG
jgi:hypothetical protein